jgi:hypothetical protein
MAQREDDDIEVPEADRHDEPPPARERWLDETPEADPADALDQVTPVHDIDELTPVDPEDEPHGRS